MHDLFHSFTTFGLVFLTFFSGGHHVDTHHTPSPVVQEVKEHHEENIQTVTAQGSVSKFGQTVTFTFTFPENGGNVQGTISGVCTGSIQGTYSGDNLQGSANASCPFLLTTIIGTATFTGHVNGDKKSGKLYAKVAAPGMSENVEIPITLSE